MNKRDVALALAAGFAGAALAPLSGFAAGAVSAGEAKAAVMSWLDALKGGDPAEVQKILAPEFQILRSDGSGYDRDDYLKALPKFGGHPEILNLVFSSEGDLLVLRYNLQLEQKIGDKQVQKLAPRLSVMRKASGTWLMVAHANFAQIG